jgi:hypothetical protein
MCLLWLFITRFSIWLEMFSGLPPKFHDMNNMFLRQGSLPETQQEHGQKVRRCDQNFRTGSLLKVKFQTACQVGLRRNVKIY